MSVLIRRVFGQVTVQDGGRPGLRHEGIPRGGFADRASARLANRLVGRDPDAPLLELALATVEAEFAVATTIAVVGGAPSVTLERVPVQICRRLRVVPGAVLRIGGPYQGRYSYLAIGGLGGLPRWRGSSSPLQIGHGWIPEASVVRSGARLTILPTVSPQYNWGVVRARALHSCSVIEATPAPETGDYARWMTGDYATVPQFGDTDFYVEADSNRVGTRLRHGYREALPRLLPPVAMPGSSPLLPGTIQALRNGDLIVSGPDGPTVGGYPRIGRLTADGSDALAQATGRVRIRLLTSGDAARPLKSAR